MVRAFNSQERYSPFHCRFWALVWIYLELILMHFVSMSLLDLLKISKDCHSIHLFPFNIYRIYGYILLHPHIAHTWSSLLSLSLHESFQNVNVLFLKKKKNQLWDSVISFIFFSMFLISVLIFNISQFLLTLNSHSFQF